MLELDLPFLQVFWSYIVQTLFKTSLKRIINKTFAQQAIYKLRTHFFNRWYMWLQLLIHYISSNLLQLRLETYYSIAWNLIHRYYFWVSCIQKNYDIIWRQAGQAVIKGKGKSNRVMIHLIALGCPNCSLKSVFQKIFSRF